MSRSVQCSKLNATLPGLEFAPFKGALGQKIYQHISAEAWRQWVRHSTMIINEYRLNPADPEAQQFLFAELEAFLFGAAAQNSASDAAVQDAADHPPSCAASGASR